MDGLIQGRETMEPLGPTDLAETLAFADTIALAEPEPASSLLMVLNQFLPLLLK